MIDAFFDGSRSVFKDIADLLFRLLAPFEVERLFMNYEIFVVQLCKNWLSNGGTELNN